MNGGNGQGEIGGSGVAMIFCCPRFDKMSLLELSRLYAFPSIPELPSTDGFAILDSGAWELAQQEAKMSREHIDELADHYRAYGTERVHCIAPDEYLNPWQTMKNWQLWQQNYAEIDVVPVIQFDRAKKLDLFTAIKQARFYAPCKPPFIAISNPGLHAIESASMVQICARVRRITGAKWLHNLGAGWSPRDIADWRQMNCFDSIDSVSYYTDAQSGWRWRIDGKREQSNAKWRELAHHNARIAVRIAHG